MKLASSKGTKQKKSKQDTLKKRKSLSAESVPLPKTGDDPSKRLRRSISGSLPKIEDSGGEEELSGLVEDDEGSEKSTSKKRERDESDIASGDEESSKTPKSEPKPAPAQYRTAEFAVSIEYAADDDDNPIDWSSSTAFTDRPIARINVPESRPKGTSGEKEGGHLTPWVAVRSEIHQAVRQGMSLEDAIVAVKKLVDTYEKMPGHSRGQYLNSELVKTYVATRDRLLKLNAVTDLAPALRGQYLTSLIDAYMRARSALPLAAVATTDNKGHGESKVNELLWNHETGVEKRSTAQLAGLLWSLLDVGAAHEWAEAVDQSEFNFQAMSPRRDDDEPEPKEDVSKPETWSTYDRRMVEVFVQHIMGVRQAYPTAFAASDMASEAGILKLFEWLKDPKKLKLNSGVKKVSGKYWSDLHNLSWGEKDIAAKIAAVLKKAEAGEYTTKDKESDSD